MTPDQLAAVAVEWWNTLPASQRSPEALDYAVQINMANTPGHHHNDYEATLAQAQAEARRLAGFGEDRP